MNRRDFLRAGAAGLAAAAMAPRGLAFAADRPKRVGLIGSGWYGKIDLLRLIQVAPVEVVSLCDVDRRMLADAADMVAARQASKKRPRTYGDYRKMLAEKDLDIVLVATPDHWHALPMIAAVEAGADVYVQKPISVDVVEGQAMLAAARKHQPRGAGGHAAAQHAAPGRGPRPDPPRRQAGQDRAGGDLLLLSHARPRAIRPTRPRPPELDYEMWTGPAPMRPYNELVHPRGWRAVHGIRQRHRGRHVRPHVRHGPLDARPGLAQADRLDRRHPRATRTARPTSPTRRRPPSTSATSTSSGSTAPGASRPIRNTPGAPRSTATRAR